MTDQGPRGFAQPSLRPARRLLPGLGAPPQAPPGPPGPPPDEAPPPGPPTASFGPMPATPEPRATGPLGPAPEAPPPVNAPYGMRPGQRHLLPGISNVANPPPRLDTSGDFELVAPSGAVIPVRSQNSRDKEIVTKLGQSLFNGSANEREQAVARAVTEWGQSIVGQMPIQDIQKIMAERWDHNVGNVVKRDVSRDRIDAALANKGANNRNPNLLGKDDAAAVGKQFEMENAVSDRYQRNNKGSAINVMVGNFNRLEALIDSDSPMAQRVAPMIELLELTGKASVESERAGVMQAAGGPGEGFEYGGWSASYYDEAPDKMAEKQKTVRL